MTCGKVAIAYFAWGEVARQHKFCMPWHVTRSRKQILYVYLITCERTMFVLSRSCIWLPKFLLSFSWLETSEYSPRGKFYHVLIGRQLWGWEVRKTNRIAPPRDGRDSRLAENKNTRIWLAELKWIGRTDGRMDGRMDGPSFEVFWTSHYTQP